MGINKITTAIVLSSIFSLTGCGTIAKITNQEEKLIGRQPQHLIHTKDEMFLKGPVKSVTYLRTRPGFTGSPFTKELTVEFNTLGQVTRITGDKKVLEHFGYIRYLDLPHNTAIEYGNQNELLTYETAEATPKYEYKGGVEEVNEETGNVKTFWLKHVKNKDTSAEKRYNTLDYYIYGDNQYMQIRRDNRNREENIASIYQFDDQQRLKYVYVHENNYPLDKKPSVAMSSPKKYRFSEKKKITYDHQGRISQVRQSKRNGQLTTTDRWTYKIKTDLPRRMSSVDGNGAQQFKVEFSDYEVDNFENWTKRNVKTTVRRGDREGIDERKITYFTAKELGKD